jgi:inosine-uridine nucleoside N-ribohydrolase
MLLAFAAKSDELDILMLSLTFGNVEVQKYVLSISFLPRSSLDWALCLIVPLR